MKELSDDEINLLSYQEKTAYWTWLAKKNNTKLEKPKLKDKELLKNELLEKIGDLSEIEVMGNRVMVAVYIPEAKTASGIILTDKTMDEYEYQGKVCLVLKKGKVAFQSDASVDFHGQDVEIGDWVLVSANNRKNFLFRDVLCAHVEDIRIEQKITHPDEYY